MICFKVLSCFCCKTEHNAYSADYDLDGLTDREEMEIYDTDPDDKDSDDDGLITIRYVRLRNAKHNYCFAPTHGSSKVKGTGLLEYFGMGTDPLDPDTDGDGIPDGIEVGILSPSASPTAVSWVTTENGNGTW